MNAGGRWVAVAMFGLGAIVASDGSAASSAPAIVVVGDSLTAANLSLIRGQVEAGGVTSVEYAALSGRKIAEAVRIDGGVRRSSGIEEVARLKGQGVDPAVWVVELGTNDIFSIKTCGCSDPVAFAGALIDLLVAEIGPGEPIAWVTVLDRNNIEASGWFNHALRRRAAVDPLFIRIDWYERGVDHPEWFIDHVHHNLAGVDAFAEMYLEGFRQLLASPLDAPRTGRPTAVRAEYDGFGSDDVAR